MIPELLDKIAEIKRIAKIIGDDYRHTETIIDICEPIELDHQIEKRLKMDRAIKLSLETWYDQDHPFHLDPLHPAIGLAGEAGELLDLYKKERFKDGVSWWDCIKCKASKLAHKTPIMIGVDGEGVPYYACDYYTPKILDELGDLWYYLRILAYQTQIELFILDHDISDNIFTSLVRLNYNSSLILARIDMGEDIPSYNLRLTYKWLQMVLRQLDYSLTELTEHNYNKLKDGDHHGWKKTAP